MSSGEAVSAQEAAPERVRGGPWAPAAPKEARARWKRPGNPKFFNVRHPKFGSSPRLAPAQLLQSFLQGTVSSFASSPRGGLPGLRSALSGHPQTHFCPAGLRRSATACALLGHMEAPKGSDQDRRGQAEPQVPGARRLARALGSAGRAACLRPPAISGPQPLEGSGLGSPFEASLGGRSQGPGHPAACREARLPPGPRGGPIPGSPDDARP